MFSGFHDYRLWEKGVLNLFVSLFLLILVITW